MANRREPKIVKGQPRPPKWAPFDADDIVDNTCGLCFQTVDEDGFHKDGVCPEYDELEDEYENVPKRGKVSKPSNPKGSLTGHLRSVRSNRDGAHKRSKKLNKGK